MIADKIKSLRKAKNITQSALAKRLGITRSSVNAWEAGVSVPSTMYVVALARIFGVSTDYLLERHHGAVLDVSGLDDEAIRILNEMVQYMKDMKGKRNNHT